MQISAIQNHQSKNSLKELQAKKASYSTGITKDLATDSFSKEKINRNVSFKGEGGLALGAIVGFGAALAIVCTGGLAAPVVAAALAADAVCIVAGASIDSDKKQ